MGLMFGPERVACFEVAGEGVTAAITATAERPKVEAFPESAEPVLFASVKGMLAKWLLCHT